MNLKELLLKYKEPILYLFFGVLTTVVNILTFHICRTFHIELLTSNLIAWVVSVLVAFVTNKFYVFESSDLSMKIVMKEAILFFSARIFSLGVDMAVIAVMVKVLVIPEMISKIVSNVIVIVMNYVLSKLIIFKK